MKAQQPLKKQPLKSGWKPVKRKKRRARPVGR